MSAGVTKRFVLLIALVLSPVMSAQGQSLLSIANPSLPDGIVVVPYHQQLFATGGTAPYAWTISAGSLPAGMRLDAATGILSGTPTVAGDYPFTVQATDQAQFVGRKALTLKIVPGFGDLVAVDRDTGYVYAVASDGTKSSIGSSLGTGIPAGPEDVAVDPNTGDVYAVTSGNGVWKISPSGTTQQFYTGTFSGSAVAIAVDRNSNVYVAENLTNRVYKLNSSGALVGNPFATLAAYVGSAQEIRMLFDRDGNLIVGAGGGGSPKIDSISPGGVVTHIYTGGATVPFTGIGGMAFANDGSGALVVADWRQHSLIKITDIGTGSMATTTLRDLASVQSTPIGLVAHPTNRGEYYLLTFGGLYRVVLGTNSVIQIASFTYGTDIAWARFAQAAYLTISPAAVADGTVGVNYTQQFSATNVTGAANWAITAGSLPPGLTLDAASGVLWGTPTQPGDYRFTLTVTYGGQSAHQALTLKIVPGFGDLVISDSQGVYRVGLDGSKAQIDNGSAAFAYGVAADADGNGYAVASGVWKFPPVGVPQHILTSVSGLAIAVDRYGNMYLGDNSADVVYKVNSSGQQVDAAGNPTTNPFVVLPSSPGEAEDIRMIFDRDGYLLVVSDALGAQQIQRVSPTGEVTNLFAAGSAPFTRASGITFANDGSGALVVADFSQNSLIKISNVGTPNMVASTLITSSSLCCNMTGIVAHPTNPGEYLVVINDAPSGANSTLKRVVPATGSVTTVAGFTYALDVASLRFSQTATPVNLTLGNLTQTYDGTPRSASVATTPTGVSVAVTYTGTGATVYAPSSTPPTNAGTYRVDAVAQGIYQGSTTDTLTIAPRPLTITANSQSKTYGYQFAFAGTEFVATGLVSNDTVTSVGLTSVGATANAGVALSPYTITAAGAVGSGLANYAITYVPGLLTVNQARLTIIADNKSMGAGSQVPPLTASYFGFVNGDTAATALTGGAPILALQGFNGAAGTYTITVPAVTAPNYSIASVNGQLTVNASALNFFNNFFATGDYAIGITNLPGSITVATPGGGAIPQGAHILAAFLYWQTVESATSAAASRIQFRGYDVLGAQQLGSDIAFTDGTLSGVLRTYRANVLPYLPVTTQGLSGTPVSVSMPADWATNGSRHAIGAGLVVVYRVLSQAMPLKAVILYDGSWVASGGTGVMNQDIRGFYEAAPGTAAAAHAITNNGTALALTTLNPTISGDHVPVAINNAAAGGVMVFSTPVNAGVDGLLASWKSAHGYQDARDGTWVDLPDAAAAGQDLYVQIDYMCSVVAANGACDTQTGHSHLPRLEALEQVAQAFANHGINVHFDVGNNYQGQPHIVPVAVAKGGNIIPEETCVDADPANPQCVVPNEPGLVGWKLGLGLAKMGPRDSNACATTGNCSPRFQHGRKDSYHYALFAHSMAAPAWSFANGRLVSIIFNGNTATITTSVPHHLADLLAGGAAARITVAEAISQPYLNGIYVPTIVDDFTFTIPVKNVSGVVSGTTDPSLAIYSGKKSSSSGYSDVGGADTVVTLGNWKFCLVNGLLTNVCPNGTPQDDSLRVNVQAGTLMHELGHSLSLTHGGTYYQTPGTYVANYEANCKSNYQSVMNYLFQIDLLGPNHDVLDYSGQILGSINEGQAGNASAWLPTYSTTGWYSPTPMLASNINTESAATRHCDGSAIAPNEMTMYRWDAAVSSLAWVANQDVNFDGNNNEVMQGYDDWGTYDLRQIGATGSHFVSGGVLLPNGGGILLPNGGGIVLPNGGGVLLPDGSVVLPNGAGVLLPNGGGVQLPNGGGVLLADGGVLLPNGGGILLPNGGGVQLPNGGGTILSTNQGVQLPNGGGILLPNGGGVQLPNGGGIVLPNGGGVLLPNGGGVQLANGGGVLLPNGGGVQLPNGGGVLLPNGGGVLLPNGGGVQLPNGGGVLLPNGGGIQLPNGGGIQLPNGGGVLLPNGGGILLPNGGGALLANGGGIQLPNGGGVTLPNGGGVLFPNGGGILFPNGGGILFPNGGGEEMDYETANSFVRPPYALTKTQADGGVVLVWQAPNFGVISAYRIYRGDGTLACEVTGNPPPTTCPVPGDSLSTDYRATTIVPPADVNGQPRSSQPSDPARENQTITFPALSPKTFGDSDFTVTATATPSGLPVSFTAAGTCTVTGALVHLTGAGTCTVTASQAGNTAFNPAPTVSQSIAILQANQAITFAALPNKVFGDPDFTVSATASSGLPVSFSGTGNCTVANVTVHLTAPGSCTVTASQAGNGDYKPAAPVSQTFTIAAWTIDGFHSPVSMPQNGTAVWNIVKAGSTVPLKFNIYAGAVEQTALSAVTGVAISSVPCESGAVADLTGFVDTATDTSLRYDGTQFIQNWKTTKSAGLCYAVRMTARDGSRITAYFKTK